MGVAWIDYLFKVAVCLSAAYIFYRCLLRDDASFLGNRLFLLAMLPVSFLLPLTPLRSPFRSLTFDPSTLSSAAALPAAGTPSAPAFAFIVVILYWTGAALFLLRIAFHLFHLFRLQRLHPRERLRNITLVRVGSPIPPFSFFNRIFLHAAKNSDALELRQIISHELVHIRQLHSLDILVMELALALQWFNPIVWFYKKALKETHEYLADREVLAQGFNADGYRLLLFEQQFGAKLFEFASHLKQSQIQRRMFMMNRMQGAGKAPLKIILALPLIALLALALAEPRLIIAQSAATADTPEVAQKKDKAAMSDQELKAALVLLDEKEKSLKEKFALTENAGEKQKLKETLDQLYHKRQSLLTGHAVIRKADVQGASAMDKEKLKQLEAKFAEKKNYLEQLYASAESAEQKEKIQRDLDMLHKKRQIMLSEMEMKMAEMHSSREELEKKLQFLHQEHMKLEQVIAQEEDRAKREELKLKQAELAQLEKELKIKLQESQEKQR